MSDFLNIGIVGAGVFGGYHANKYTDAISARVVSIFDPAATAAQALASKVGASAFGDYAAFLNTCDAVVVACPAEYHFDACLKALEAGKDVFVEKPIATDAKAAFVLCDVARKHDRILQVGHQERYVLSALGLLDLPTAPKALTFSRQSQASTRCCDVSVVLDLMIHDIDIACAIFGQSVGHCVHARGDWDSADATVEFTNGAMASFHGNRGADGNSRTLTMTFTDGKIEFDFQSRTIKSTLTSQLPRRAGENIEAALVDPLGYGARCFVDAVKSRTTPFISGVEGAAAVAIACDIEEKIGLHEFGENGSETRKIVAS